MVRQCVSNERLLHQEVAFCIIPVFTTEIAATGNSGRSTTMSCFVRYPRRCNCRALRLLLSLLLLQLFLQLTASQRLKLIGITRAFALKWSGRHCTSSFGWAGSACASELTAGGSTG